MNWDTLIWLILWSAALLSLRGVIANFRGASQSVLLALNISALLSAISAVAFYVGSFYYLRWYEPILLFVLSMLFSSILSPFVDRWVGRHLMASVAAIVWPIPAYLAWQSIAP